MGQAICGRKDRGLLSIQVLGCLKPVPGLDGEAACGFAPTFQDPRMGARLISIAFRQAAEGCLAEKFLKGARKSRLLQRTFINPQHASAIQQGVHILDNPIEYLKGVGPQRGELLRKELNIHSFRDLLEHFPLRHIDRSRIFRIGDITPDTDYIQLSGKLIRLETIGDRRSKRLVGTLFDGSSELELVWFQGISWVLKSLQLHQTYLVFGRISLYNGNFQMAHPEIDTLHAGNAQGKAFLEPVYPSTEKLKVRGLNGRALSKLTKSLLEMLHEHDLPENLPAGLLEAYRLMPRFAAYQALHFPRSEKEYQHALRRLKFEELFIAQLRICRVKLNRHQQSKGWIFSQVGHLFRDFYEQHLPFELTEAQKRVIREIRADTGSGRQMNRLLQGDVGSGKTIVAVLSMLIALDNGFQCCLMAPTEILAQQHFQGITEMLKEMPLRVDYLSGQVKGKQRQGLLEAVSDGRVDILIGTHALIEKEVRFENLGLAIIDEQHRFGVAQRALMWEKNAVPPHILVMTATPIPRTLAMTVYGDLDVSVIDALPPGRKPVQTVHRSETRRPQVMSFIRHEIDQGRQAYIVYPLIQESEKVDFENLMEGYEQVKAYFPEPAYYISMVHGRQPSDQKETNMQRFIHGDCQIMMATTVIEVGVNVPNASVMVIENAERYGLSQLHQLRGRVGRGADKSYCVLMTGDRLSRDGRQRIQTMVQTTNGFEIAEKDLELRGPGELEGTRQSGVLGLKLSDLVEDKNILEAARKAAIQILDTDPHLQKEENQGLISYLRSLKHGIPWSQIS